MQSTTICAPVTGAGHAAIGVFRLSGPDALAICNTLLPKPIRIADERRMQYRTVLNQQSGAVIDDALVCYYAAPASYTGEDVVEFFCHGNPYILSELKAQCLKLGALLAAPGEFTRRAFVNGRMDLSQAEAVADLIESKGAAALSNARRLFEGVLSKDVSDIRDRLLSVIAEFEAGIDFSDDIEDPVNYERVAQDLSHVSAHVQRLVASYTRGSRLSQLAVGIVGPVNAGKSTLLNLLLGNERAIVSTQKGTTRDYIEADCVVGPYVITLVDTAGCRSIDEMDALERKGYELGQTHIQGVDLKLSVIDMSTLASADLERAGQIVVLNKADLLNGQIIQENRKAVVDALGKTHTVISTSLVSEEGRQRAACDIRSAIQSHLDQLLRREESVSLTQQRQVDALNRCAEYLAVLDDALKRGQVPELLAEHVREALQCVGEITGDSYTEQVLDTVFSRFCLGK